MQSKAGAAPHFTMLLWSWLAAPYHAVVQRATLQSFVAGAQLRLEKGALPIETCLPGWRQLACSSANSTCISSPALVFLSSAAIVCIFVAVYGLHVRMLKACACRGAPCMPLLLLLSPW